MTNTWGHRQAQEYMGDSVDRVETTVEQVERRLWKTWRRAVEDGGDTRRGSEDRWTVSGFGPQNPGKDSGGNRGGVPEEVGGQVAESPSLRRGEVKS